MTRKEFLKICSILGISLPLQSVFGAEQFFDSPKKSVNFKGKILIIGAGAAGLTAAYRLAQLGIDFQILEASPNLGGRMKTVNDFVDFPIPLGAEWLHVEKSVFNDIVNDAETSIAIETKGYESSDYGLYDGEEISMDDMGFDIDQKFVNSSWLDFFKTYVVPTIESNIQYNQIVESVTYHSDGVSVATSTKEFKAAKVIVTVPVKMLQKKAIRFVPALPEKKLKAIEKVTVWDGFKAFIEFSEKFYPTVIETSIRPRKSGQKLYYDASYGQHSERNVLGFLALGTATLPYAELSDQALLQYMLKELDALFDGQASEQYLQHITQNWSREPFIEGAYVYDQERWRTVKVLGQSVNNRLYFAGTSYTDGSDWGSVHAAAKSALRCAAELLN